MKDFVPYEQTIEIMNLGFNGPYIGWYWNLFDGWPQDEDAKWVLEDRYNNDSRWHEKAITYSQAFRWFREKHDLKVSFPYWNGFNKMIPEYLWYKYEIMIIPANHHTISVRDSNGGIFIETYEEAELACLKKMIEIVKTKQNE